jgi:site-specific DNA recombinase
MASSLIKTLRCAIYTRKSTEHGLELEFNSLHAQREACEAFIKSQASLGWECLPDLYDDPAFSGGTLERPALKQLLTDIDAGRVDVIVVYKIDRLTRSLADFAKLVEIFDTKSISFVAVTQQFNTTTSMGRLTLNVLLSFAQFERELSSERVRDKVAASRQKGKWTGGTVPLGYDVKDKKLVPHPVERQTIEYIFRKYIELQSFQKLIMDLDEKKIVTKRRNAKIKKYRGGIPFTYGPLAYLLKNRVYLGEMHHKGKWYPGEQEGILPKILFDQVQTILESHKVDRRVTRTQSGALLTGKLFDDRGNVMSPTYTTKKGIRYRFYVSSALLRGRKSDAGTVHRIKATDLENLIVETAQREAGLKPRSDQSPGEIILELVQRVEVHANDLRLHLICSSRNGGSPNSRVITIPWPSKQPYLSDPGEQSASPQTIHAIVRAHAWLRLLEQGAYTTIDDLAAAVGLNPTVARQSIRLAFLDPTITEDALTGNIRFDQIADLQRQTAMNWQNTASRPIVCSTPKNGA